MNLSNIIETYLKGWELGDAELSLSVTAENFRYDDPNTGTILRHEFIDFVNDFKRAAVEMGALENTQPFLNYSDTLIQIDKSETMATVSCWWQAVGTDLQGSALIKASDQGILYEKNSLFFQTP